jgi:hypothetical protein
MSKQTCPRRLGEVGPWSREEDQDAWRPDGSCSFCGSISPDTFMEAARRGDLITPTDKNYKAYVDLPNPREGEVRIVGTTNSREHPGGNWVPVGEKERADLDRAGSGGLQTTYVLYGTEGPKDHRKFYFQHLSPEQRREFVDLLNAGTLNLAYPGHFYRLPFFVAPAAP